jgi:hypothetical protein
MDELGRPVITVILGAGASRDVSYATGEGCSGGDLGPSMPSPLDGDFFDLLQQLATRIEESEAKASMRRIIDKVLNWRGQPLWRSMESMFYNLHVSAVLEHKLYCGDRPPDLARQLVNDFLCSIRILLGEAHGRRVCLRHHLLLQELYATDAVLTFNYDFVAEQALAELHGAGTPFGDWFYGLGPRSSDGPNEIPTLYKLHGSLNWQLKEDSGGETQNARRNWPKTWSEFAQELEYVREEPDGYLDDDPLSRPPVLLPYWEKRVEKGLWLTIWKAAADQLLRTGSLVIWGYSLPTTDLKAQQLLTLAFLTPDPESKLNKIIVIDPSPETQERWRRMFLSKPFFRFSSFQEFKKYVERQNAPMRAWLASTNIQHNVP